MEFICVVRGLRGMDSTFLLFFFFQLKYYIYVIAVIVSFQDVIQQNTFKVTARLATGCCLHKENCYYNNPTDFI